MRAVKSVSIDSERRVIITYLDGSTETLYPNCIWCDSEALRQLIKDLLEEKADAITQTIENVSVATFADGAYEGLIKKLLVSIDLIQEGTGDPSPENVRPISGRTGLTVFHSGADTSDPTTISVNWETEAGTVYGGTLDVVSGKLTVTHKGIVLNGSEDWTRVTGDYYYCRTKIGEANTVKANIALCDRFVRVVIASTSNNQGINVYNSVGANGAFIGIRYDDAFSCEDVESLKNWLSLNNTKVVYELSNPLEIQLTLQEITTLLGGNNIWADSGNILELEYTADTKLYIGEQQSGTSGTLGSNMHTITIPDLQPVSEKIWEDVEEAYKEEATDERGEE